MSEPKRLPGRTVVLVLLAAIVLFAGVFMVSWWRGPKGRFTAETLAKPAEPVVVRTFCIDPALPGPRELDVRQRCSNADRLEFSMNPGPGAPHHVAWVMVGPEVVGVSVHGELAKPWEERIPIKGFTPGAYALLYVVSDRPIDEKTLRGAVEVPSGNLARLQALELWLDARQKEGAQLHVVRLPFHVDAAQG